jgi:hypothetical protein
MVNIKKWQRILIAFIFILALGLRLILAFINKEANDNHFEVINWIVDKNEIPQNENCWECFQPKLFYLLDAGIIKVFNIKAKFERIRCEQFINVVFSFFILLILWKFIRVQPASFALKAWCFALIAFNPCLIGINIQATNDTFEILAGVGAIYYVDLFFKHRKISAGICMIIFAILSSIIKASGIVIILSIALIFLIKIIFSISGEKRIILKMSFIFLTSSMLIVPFAGGYYQNYQKYQTPFANNISVSDLPVPFYHQVYTRRPGITSIVHGYFTFWYWDMVKTPYITNDQFSYPLHRTSLWSQLYGRTFFLHFDQHPASWMSMDPNILLTGSGLLLLGIFPVFLFLIGFSESVFKFFKNLFTKNRFSEDSNRIHAIFVILFLLFVVKYSYDYIDFSTMKSIFLFPAILSFTIFFISGLSKIKSKRLMYVFHGIFSAIIVFSIFDICFLIHQLW